MIAYLQMCPKLFTEAKWSNWLKASESRKNATKKKWCLLILRSILLEMLLRRDLLLLLSIAELIDHVAEP